MRDVESSLVLRMGSLYTYLDVLHVRCGLECRCHNLQHGVEYLTLARAFNAIEKGSIMLTFYAQPSPST